MTTSVLEVISGPGLALAAFGATTNATTTTAPTAGDCVFVILSAQFDRVITGVSGLGGTWERFYSYTEPTANYGSQSIWVCANPVSAGVITATVAGTGTQLAAAQLTTLHVRGLPNPVPIPMPALTGSSVTGKLVPSGQHRRPRPGCCLRPDWSDQRLHRQSGRLGGPTCRPGQRPGLPADGLSHPDCADGSRLVHLHRYRQLPQRLDRPSHPGFCAITGHRPCRRAPLRRVYHDRQRHRRCRPAVHQRPAARRPRLRRAGRQQHLWRSDGQRQRAGCGLEACQERHPLGPVRLLAVCGGRRSSGWERPGHCSG